MNVKVSEPSDVKSYDDSFSECSKILDVTENGYFITIFTINKEYEKR